MSGRALRLCIILLAGYGAFAFRLDKRAKQGAAQKQFVESKLNAKAMALAKQTSSVRIDGDTLTRIVTTLVGIATSMVTAFSEDPPDLNYAIRSIDTQGWKLVDMIVPEEHQGDDFDKAKRVWKAVFADVAENPHELWDAWNKEDVRAIVDTVLATVNSALFAVAEAIPEDKDLILAIRDLVQGVADHVMEFVTDMGWLAASGSFVQVAQSDLANSAMEPAQLNELLRRGLEIFTSFVSALSEDPPDFHNALHSMNLEGWEIVKLLVPEEDQQSDGFKSAHEVWNRVFADAPDITERIVNAWKEGDIATLIKSILSVVETALQAAAEVAEEGDAKILNGVAKLVVALGDEWLRFSDRIGWPSSPDQSPIDGNKLMQIVSTAVGICTSVVTAFSENPPDIEYAFNVMSIKGWKIIELIVPAEDHLSPDFDKAERAWKAVFAGVAKNFDKLLNASNEGDVRGIIDEVLRNVNSALTSVAEALPEDSDLILAIRDLVQGMSDSVLEFTTTMGWLDESGSFVQVVQSDPLTSAMDPAKITQLLTVGVGLFTTVVAAFSEDPPDLDYAFGSFRIQGWKMVRLLVPDEDQLLPSFKDARTEWNNFFYDAPELAEPILNAWNAGDIATVVKSTVTMVDAALTVCARAAPDSATILNGVAKLLVSLTDEWLLFAGRVGWLA